MCLTAFECEAPDPCDPDCTDDNATLCIMFPPSNQICWCNCAWGHVNIFIYEDDEMIDRREIPFFVVPRGPDVGIQWCSDATIRTCRNLKVEVAILCKDSDCYDDVFTALESPYAVKIPCNQATKLWATFGCNQGV